MSDIARKRSRKAKLVPRMCSANSGDENDSETSQDPVKGAIGKKIKSNLVIKTDSKHLNCVTLCGEASTFDPISDEIPVNIITVKQIKREIDTDASSGACPEPCQDAPTTNVTRESVPLAFDIKVEVEKCDEYLPQEIDELKNEGRKVIDKTSFWDYCGLIQFTLTNERILEAAAKVLEKSTSIADKIMDIAVKNTIGHQEPGVSYYSRHEAKIQMILNDWIQWKLKHFLRDAPMLYKCHICELCWWNLQEFRDHIERHDNIVISMETKLRHETNLIAYLKFRPGIVEIEPQGNCRQCGKDYAYHKQCRHVSQECYFCPDCGSQFFTCTSLAAHISIMHKKPEDIKCIICPAQLDPSDMTAHLQTVHAVRSDLPIITKHSLYKTCTVCFGRFITFNQHVCGTKGFHIQCQYCFRGFTSSHLSNSHMELSHKMFQCEICHDWFKYKCTRYEHILLKHTDKYTLVIKCVLCDEYNVFISLNGGLLHMETVHPDRQTRQKSYFVKVIVPKLCLHPCFDDSYIEPTYIESEELPIKSDPGKTGVLSKPGELEEPDEPGELEEPDEPDEPDEPGKPEDLPEEFVETLIKVEPKEEPKEDLEEEENFTENNFLQDLNVKEEYEESDCDLEEYEDDIIKLDVLHSPAVEDTQDCEEFLDESENQSMDTYEHTENSQESMEQESSETESSNQESSDCSIIRRPRRTPKDGNRRLYTCTICGFQAYHREYKIHVDTKCKKTSKRIENSSFHCSQCARNFRSLRKYLAHLPKHGYKALTCQQCSKAFKTLAKMAAHVFAHVRQAFLRVKSITAEDAGMTPEYQCKQCSAAVDVSEFFDHWEAHITAGSTIEPLESDRFVGKNKVHDEQKKIPDKNIQLLIDQIQIRSKECNYCHRLFKRHNDCKRHLIEHLLVDAYDQKAVYQSFRCQICGAQLSTVVKYKQHMRDHANLPVYRCDLCDRTFSDSSNFTKHKKVHNFKSSYVCDLCSKKFQSKMGLMKHIKLHQKTEPILCQPCNKMFYFESSYRRHVKSAHERVPAAYPCVICSARFSSLKHKWKHMWEVHKERKNEADCPICHKSFRIYAEVKRHLKEYHYTNVTVGRLKNKTSLKKTSLDEINLKCDLKSMLETAPVFRLGEQETLVVYE